MKDTWELRNACSRQETQYFGLRESVEKCGICQASSKAAKPVGNVSDVPPDAWHTLGTDLFLLEQDRLPGDWRLLLQVPDH